MAAKHTGSSLAKVAKVSVSAKKRTKKTSRRAPSGTAQAAIPEKTHPSGLISPILRHQMIEEAAYYLAQGRGFIPGYEVEDWLMTESEIDAGRGS